MIEVQRHIRARPETVFPYFTDPARYVRWMGVEAILDARPGGIYRVRVPQGRYAVGEFVAVEPPQRVVFTWGWEGDPSIPPGSSTVTITLTPTEDGTLITLVHDGLPDPTSEALHTQGWERYLTRLATAGGGGEPGPDVP